MTPEQQAAILDATPSDASSEATLICEACGRAHKGTSILIDGREFCIACAQRWLNRERLPSP
jgi:formylmethanofuran dehydrogenase subunit E